MKDERLLKMLVRAITDLNDRIDELENERIYEKKEKRFCRVVDFTPIKSAPLNSNNY